MAYVSVDVDLDDIDFDDLVNELCERLNRSKRINPKQKKELIEACTEILASLDQDTDTLIEVKSLDDKIKYEHLKKVFNKYSTSQFETLTP